MPPDDSPDTTATAASPPGPAAPAAFDPSALPPEVVAWVEAEKRKASDAAAAAARRAVEQKAKPAPTQPTAQPTATPDDALSLLALRDAFDDAIGDLPLKSAQKSLVREAVMRDRPQDVAAYVTRFADRAGWSTAAPAAPSQPPAASAPPVPAVPATHRAPPPPTPTVTENTPILSMSPADREALEARIGRDKYVEQLTRELVKTRVPLTS